MEELTGSPSIMLVGLTQTGKTNRLASYLKQGTRCSS